MDIGQAFSMFHVDAISGAKIIEKPGLDRSVWVVKFDMTKELPSHMSTSLETARGEEKIFKSMEAVLKDLKTIGFSEVQVVMSTVESFRRNRFAWMYEWIRGLHAEGYDEGQILLAFAKNPSMQADLQNEEAVRLIKKIIQHALGFSDGMDLIEYLPPVDVLDIKRLHLIPEGYLFLAICTSTSENFYFLLEHLVSEKQLLRLLTNWKDELCKRALIAAHMQSPIEISDSEIQVVTCMLTKNSLVDLID